VARRQRTPTSPSEQHPLTFSTSHTAERRPRRQESPSPE